MISLVMATVGRTEEIRRLIESLILQKEKRFELIAVDQNNDDRLVPILADAIARGLEIKHLRLEKPNLSKARNLGIDAARYPIVGFPDDDCWYDPLCLEGVCHEFFKNDKLGACIALWEERDSGSHSIAPHLLEWKVVSAFRSVPISSITLFIKHEKICTVGGFDNRLGIGRWYGSGEETDLVMRLVRHGYQIQFSPNVIVHHATNLQRTDFSLRHLQALRRRARGTGAVYAKHKLGAYVILRGLMTPSIRGLINLSAFLSGVTISLGRLEGYLKWRMYESQSRACH